MHLCAHSCFNHFQTCQICNTKNSVDMCARHGRGAIEIRLSEKGVLAKKDWETLRLVDRGGQWGQCPPPPILNAAPNIFRVIKVLLRKPKK